MPVIVKPLLPEQGEEALSFIQPYESECDNLAAELLRGGTDCWAVYYQEASQTSGAENENSPQVLERRISRNIRAHDQVRANSGIDSQDQKLAGLIALRKKRSLFFCLPFAKYKSAFDKKVCSEAQRPLMEFFESNEPFCVNGEAAGAVFLRNILKNKKTPMRPSVTNKYFLLTRDGEASQAQDAGGGSGLEKDLRVVQATSADYESLLPLELGYQREEVVPKSFDISDAALAAAFKESLADGNHYALEISGKFVAMAKVTSQGRRFAMLGGVYTIPSERKKGRAAFLVRQIIAGLQAPSRDGQRQTAGGASTDFGAPNICLYAKQENAAALALYKSLGFVPRGEYLLVYY